jgi:hypothetical protein
LAAGRGLSWVATRRHSWATCKQSGEVGPQDLFGNLIAAKPTAAAGNNGGTITIFAGVEAMFAGIT